MSGGWTLYAWAQLRRPTELYLAPENPTVASGGNFTLTAVLTSEGRPLADRTITPSAILGAVIPRTGIIDTAPETPVGVTVKIEATSPGGLHYRGDTATSSGVIEAAPLIALLKEASLVGASFVVPETLKDGVVALSHYGVEWVRLLTRAVDENATHVMFKTPRFSTFAITASAPAVGTGVRGYVLDDATGRPIEGAKVIALPKVITLARAGTTTDEMGGYVLSLAPGSYVLVVSASGYADASAEVSLALGEVRRVDFRLEKAAAEFSEDWHGVKFEVALVGNLTWEIGSDASFKVSATVSDIGGNQKIEFRQLKIELGATGVAASIQLDFATSVGGTVFSKSVSVRVMGAFDYHAPE